jgi:hypothetical protein
MQRWKDDLGNFFWSFQKDIDKEFHHDCVIVKLFARHFCGYVKLEKTSNLFGKRYDELTHLEVHGGVTYAGPNLSLGLETPSWYIGFDCAHWCDRENPKNFEYVYEGLKSLSAQIYEVENEK